MISFHLALSALSMVANIFHAFVTREYFFNDVVMRPCTKIAAYEGGSLGCGLCFSPIPMTTEQRA